MTNLVTISSISWQRWMYMWEIWLFQSCHCHLPTELRNSHHQDQPATFEEQLSKGGGQEGNRQKYPAGRFHGYLWARKRRCKFSNPDFHFLSHLCFYVLPYFSLPLFLYLQFFLLFTSLATTTHALICQSVSPLKGSKVILLVSCSFLVFLYHTRLLACCPTSVAKLLLPPVSPWSPFPGSMPFARFLCSAFPP